MRPTETVNTSPPTPRFQDEPWRSKAPPAMPADVQAALESLKAKLATGPYVSETKAQRYLAALQAKRGQTQGKHQSDDQPAWITEDA